MSNVSKRLEEQADLLFKNVSGWQTNALRRIGRRVKSIKSLSYADLQALNNATIVKQDIDAILKELASLTEQTVPEVKRIYSEMIEQQHEENRLLYDYRNKPFVPFADNKSLQAIVRAYARTTADTMIKLSMTKAKQLGFADKNGNFIPLEKNFIQVIDKAVMSIATGTGDFGSEMRDVLKELGGSGLRIDYGGGVTRRLDTMVRQNLLWGAKQASVEYNEMIGEELGCDGIEIDWHSFPRPSHEFMQGRQFSLHGRKIINGVVYEDAADAKKALLEYGCLHFEIYVFLGISEPRHSPQELARLNAENSKKIEIDGINKSGYEWKQVLRRLETSGRIAQDQVEILKASGDNTGAEQLRHKVSTFEGKYQKIAQITGIKAQPEKMAVIKIRNVDTAYNMGYNIKADREQFERYKKVLKELAPQNLDEFVRIKDAHADLWNTLKGQYRILNRYEIDGKVSAKTILSLDEAAWKTKQTAFDYKMYTGKTRREIKALSKQGNAASMLLDGKIYFAHSRVSETKEIGFLAYRGNYPLVTLKQNRRFMTKDLGDGIPRHHDTEAKFLEFVASNKKTTESFNVTILSEKHICESCSGVVEQFKAMFPKATVNVVSGKRNYNKSADGLKTWMHRKRVQ